MATASRKHRRVVHDALDRASLLMAGSLTDRRGLSLTAASVLAKLDREGPARLTALAAAAGISQPAMSEQVQRLVGHGWVSRVEDPGDGRARLVAITDSGRELVAQRLRARDDRLTELLAGLPPEDEATLTLAMQVAAPILERLIAGAHEIPERQTEGRAR